MLLLIATDVSELVLPEVLIECLAVKMFAPNKFGAVLDARSGGTRYCLGGGNASKGDHAGSANKRAAPHDLPLAKSRLIRCFFHGDLL